MRREGTLADISDGRLYRADDLVRADCGGCEGCSACCYGAGDTIVLDPLDWHRLSEGLSAGLQELLASGKIGLHVEEGLILPHLAMSKNGGCGFLNEEGRCGIHSLRPGICRLFPLGRYYEGNSFRYFLQTRECRKENRAKVRIRKWLDVEDVPRYEAFVCRWHYFLKKIQGKLTEESQMKQWSLLLLEQFYQRPYEGEDFYREWEERTENFEKRMEQYFQ